MATVLAPPSTSTTIRPSAPLAFSFSKPPSRATQSHRLLYRGSLSLSDSHLLLDGLAFVLHHRPQPTSNSKPTSDNSRSPGVNLQANFKDDSSSTGQAWLENPLALALESMRGRPTLRFLGTMRVNDAVLDVDEDTRHGRDRGSEVNAYIHPASHLTRLYFDQILCTQCIITPLGRTELGIRVALGDGPDDKSEVLIYGQVSQSHPSLSASSNPFNETQGPQTLTLQVARLLPAKPIRLPRPDDPTPRQPPLTLSSGKRSLSSLGDAGPSSSNKRRRKFDLSREAGESIEDEKVRIAREIMLKGPPPAPLPGGALKEKAKQKNGEAQFKVPALPSLSRSVSVPVGKDKGKGKERAIVRPAAEGEMGEANEIEKANKNLVKSITISQLAVKGVAKDVDPEWKELFNWIYRGVCFALRAKIKMKAVDLGAVERLVKTHVGMYVGGAGGSGGR